MYIISNRESVTKTIDYIKCGTWKWVGLLCHIMTCTQLSLSIVPSYPTMHWPTPLGGTTVLLTTSHKINLSSPRNYLEHVAPLVSAWTEEQEVKYQAQLLQWETEKKLKALTAAKAAEETSRPNSAQSKRKGRSSSPKKSLSTSRFISAKISVFVSSRNTSLIIDFKISKYVTLCFF